jgi:kynureninase
VSHIDSLAFAREQDLCDPLAVFRAAFHLPTQPDGSPETYLCGNSLGLLPTRTESFIHRELEKWKQSAVRGHRTPPHPWATYQEEISPMLASLVGALPQEVVAMNSLTTNLHLLLVSFYRPTAARYKILMEAHAFPSDRYAVLSHFTHHKLSPEALVEIPADSHTALVGTEKWLEWIEREKESLAVVLLPGVQYLTGEWFDVARITKKAHEYGCYVGIDLAHAVGNLPLQLHDWGVDFACWCHYKYMNSGPGAIGGAFIHQRHAVNSYMPRFSGWWGSTKETRFQMPQDFVPLHSAEGWQLSNPAIFSLCALHASLDLFTEAGGMKGIRKKSLQLTGYLESLLENRLKDFLYRLTPRNPEARGAQLSLCFQAGVMGKKIHETLLATGITVDWREPGILRVSPAPLYNSFQDVYTFVSTLEGILR